MNTISMDKKYTTRSGLPVRILCVDRNDPDYPVVALIQTTEYGETYNCFTREGRRFSYAGEDEMDIVEVKEKHVGWINVYKNYQGRSFWAPRGQVYDTEGEAIARQDKSYENTIRCIKIEYEV